MFLPKQIVFAGASAVLLLTVLTGCKTSESKIKSQPPPTAPPAIVTNQPPGAPSSQPTLPSDSANNMASNILAWDAVEKEFQAKHGDLHAPFTFTLTNISPGAVIIYDTSTSCDCTVAKLPSKPWVIPKGGTGVIEATIDLRNKHGIVTNQIVVFTSQGNRALRVKALVPGPY